MTGVSERHRTGTDEEREAAVAAAASPSSGAPSS